MFFGLFVVCGVRLSGVGVAFVLLNLFAKNLKSSFSLGLAAKILFAEILKSSFSLGPVVKIKSPLFLGLLAEIPFSF